MHLSPPLSTPWIFRSACCSHSTWSCCTPMQRWSSSKLSWSLSAMCSKYYSCSTACLPSGLQKLADEKCMRAIMFEASKGFVNAMGKTSRFGEFLHSQLCSIISRDDGSLGSDSCQLIQAHSEASKLYDQMSPADRALLLDGVVQIWGFREVQDMIAFQEASQDLQVVHRQHEEPKLSVLGSAWKAATESEVNKAQTGNNVRMPFHPAIMFGSSEPVELYKQGDEDVAPDDARCEGLVVLPANARGTSVRNDDRFLDECLKKDGPSTKHKSPRTSSRSRVRPVDLVMQHEKKAAVKPKADIACTWDEVVLATPIMNMKNISANLRSRLAESGVYTVRGLLHHFPRTYVNFQQAGGVIESGQHLSFTGTIVSSRGVTMGASLGLVEVVVRSISEHLKDSTGSADWQESDAYESNVSYLHLKRFFRGSRYTSQWFLQKLASQYPVNSSVTASGKVKPMAQENHYEIREFNLDLWDELGLPDQPGQTPVSRDSLRSKPPETEFIGKPYPVYSAKGVLQPKTIELCIQRVLSELPLDFDPVPKEFRDRFNLFELRQAYTGIHTPATSTEANQARQRLVFDDFFYLQLGMLLHKQQVADSFLAAAGLPRSQARHGSLDMEKWSPLSLKLVKTLPYSLTNSQRKAASEIMWDLQSPVPMSRLLQGDVGCGKTIVAFLALLEVIDAGYQGALMAPTEFLASQHHQRIQGWLNELDESERPRTALLSGSTALNKARAIRSALESGEVDLVIGTHSLISESVKFAALGLAVIDEQHRFGVEQRSRLHNKGQSPSLPDESGGKSTKSQFLGAPHVLAMSATPIPRTLTLALHGDMTLSQITELPPGRPVIVTHVFCGDKKGRQEGYRLVEEELKAGGRAFFVFPVIDTSDELPDLRAAVVEFANLEKQFQSFACGLVHGRMKPQEKEDVMELFKSGKIQVLVSTTVIEVGIDIPEASVMVIEHAERYGVAQLHQLRGRVGRGTRDSFCILLGSSAACLGRLKLLEKSRDGFYLAQVDLETRGPGDLLGRRQSGNLPDFSIARLETDKEVLENARIAAEEILEAHHGLQGLPMLKQELSMRPRPPGALG